MNPEVWWCENHHLPGGPNVCAIQLMALYDEDEDGPCSLVPGVFHALGDRMGGLDDLHKALAYWYGDEDLGFSAEVVVNLDTLAAAARAYAALLNSDTLIIPVEPLRELLQEWGIRQPDMFLADVEDALRDS